MNPSIQTTTQSSLGGGKQSALQNTAHTTPAQTGQTSALRKAFDTVRAIPGHILDSYEKGFQKVEAANDARDQEMKNSNGLNQKEDAEEKTYTRNHAVNNVGKRIIK